MRASTGNSRWQVGCVLPLPAFSGTLVFISEKDDWNWILASLGLLLTGAYTSGASEAPKEPALGDPPFLPAACLPDPGPIT